MSWSKRKVLGDQVESAAQHYLRVLLLPAATVQERTTAGLELAEWALKQHLHEEGYQAGKRHREPRSRRAR
jgi:hypothetical protein